MQNDGSCYAFLIAINNNTYTNMEEIKIYTDGACSKNPGPGGCACILEYKGNKKNLSAGFKKTTNNRMELRAVIMGLEALKTKDKKVIIYSDSKYVTDSFNKSWIYNWEKEKFSGRKNADLFIRLLELYRSFPIIEFIWVKAHNGHIENESCDSMAVSLSLSNPQTEDIGYKE